MKDLARLLDKHQVFDLNADNGALKGLRKFEDTPNLKILVCGGDGTVGWVLSDIDKLGFKTFPPVGILPLGTGNDLAISLGWGSGYAGEDLSVMLDRIEDAMIVNLDRWTIVLEDFEGVKRTCLMNNYLSVGNH